MPAGISSPGPVPFVTHGVTISGSTVVKRFRHWAQAEPRREWQALTLLARYAPGLAPRPVRSHLLADPPEIIMSRLPGEPLGTQSASDAQTAAIAGAFHLLHQAIPVAVLGTVDGVGHGGGPQSFSDGVRKLAAGCPAGSLDPLPRRAYDRVIAWLDRGGARALDLRALHPVYAHGDGNLANRLWDGSRVRLVDFEGSGRGGRAQELADFVEHITVWAHAGIDAGAFLGRFDLSPAEHRQISELRRLHAAHWLMILLPGGGAYHRNPPGTLERQAHRTLELLG
jgi:hypothetical protein